MVGGKDDLVTKVKKIKPSQYLCQTRGGGIMSSPGYKQEVRETTSVTNQTPKKTFAIQFRASYDGKANFLCVQ